MWCLISQMSICAVFAEIDRPLERKLKWQRHGSQRLVYQISQIYTLGDRRIGPRLRMSSEVMCKSWLIRNIKMPKHELVRIKLNDLVIQPFQKKTWNPVSNVIYFYFLVNSCMTKSFSSHQSMWDSIPLSNSFPGWLFSRAVIITSWYAIYLLDYLFYFLSLPFT